MSLLPIYLYNHLFISVWIYGYLFYTLGYNLPYIPLLLKSTMILYFFLFKLVQLWPLGASSIGSCVALTYLPPITVDFFFKALAHFLATQDALGSSGIYPVLVLESAISSRSPGSFHWRMVLETKIWALCMLVAAGVHSF